MGNLMGNGLRHGRPFAQRRPATCGPELGTQCLLERLILTDCQGPARPELGGRARRALGPSVTGMGRTRPRAAWGHRHRLAARTRHRPVGAVEGEVLRAEQRPSTRPGTSNNIDAWRCPWPNGRAGPLSQGNIELPQPWGLLQRLRQQCHGGMLGLVRWADPHLADALAIQIAPPGLLEAVKSFGAALAAVAH